MRCSLIVTTYNKDKFLEKVLASALRQRTQLCEIIVAEDGESSAIAAVVHRFKSLSSTSIKHVFHEDIGNRKPLIMNRALAVARGDYLIFVDGDCVLRGDFVGAHLEYADPGAFLTGRRVDLSREASDFLTVEKISSGYLDSWTWWLYQDAIFGDTRTLGRMFKTPKFLRGLTGQDHVNDIRGCNFSVHKKHLETINGFCNDFSGAYGEDSDAEYRLKFLGLKMKSIKGAAIEYHLWHQEQVKDPHNQVLLKQVLEKGVYRTENGLSQVLGGDAKS